MAYTLPYIAIVLLGLAALWALWCLFASNAERWDRLMGHRTFRILFSDGRRSLERFSYAACLFMTEHVFEDAGIVHDPL